VVERLFSKVYAKIGIGLTALTEDYCYLAAKYYVEKNFVLYNIYRTRAIDFEKYFKGSLAMDAIPKIVGRHVVARAVRIAKREERPVSEVLEEMKPYFEALFIKLMKRAEEAILAGIEERVENRIKELISYENVKRIEREMLKYRLPHKYYWR